MHALRKALYSTEDKPDDITPEKTSIGNLPLPPSSDPTGKKLDYKSIPIDFSASQYYDGMGDDLLGGPQDRIWFNTLSEIEQEQELYERQNFRNTNYARWNRNQLPAATETARRKRGRNTDQATSNALEQFGKSRDGDLDYVPDLFEDDDDVMGVSSGATADSHTANLPGLNGNSGDSLPNIDLSTSSTKKPKYANVSLTLDAVRKVQLKRQDFARFSGLQWFHDLLIGSFVRFKIQAHTSADVNCYCCARIVSLSQSSPYIINQNDPNTLTNLRIGVTNGSKTSNIRVALVSNSPISQDELDVFISRYFQEGIGLPPTWELTEKEKQLGRINSRLSSQDISAISMYRNALKTGETRIDLLSANSKPELIRLLSIARQKEDSQLEILTLEKLADLDSKTKKKNSSATTTISSLNKQLARRTEQEEKHFTEATKISQQQALDGTSDKTKDPFARLKTRPSNMWASSNQNKTTTDQNLDSKEITTKSEEPLLDSTASSSIPSLYSSIHSKINQKLMDLEI